MKFANMAWSSSSKSPRHSTVTPVLIYLGIILAFLPFCLSFENGRSLENRADLSWKALVVNFGSSTKGVYWNDLSSYPGRRLAYFWTHTVIMQAALDNLNAGTQDEFLDTMSALGSYQLVARNYTGYATVVQPSESSWRYWDDNGVAGLVLVRAAQRLPDIRDRLTAMIGTIWPFIKSGMAEKGGVFWHELDPTPQRGISATGSTAELAMQVLALGGNHSWCSDKCLLSYGKINLAWLDSHLLDNKTGLYWNSWYENISDVPASCATGTNVCNWLFTYNQGFVIDLLVLLFRSTGKREYLDYAIRTANASLTYFTPSVLWKQPPPFNAILFRALLFLDQSSPNPMYWNTLDAYLDLVWTTARNTTSGIFNQGGIGTYDQTYGSIDQAAFVQMFALANST